MQMLIVPTVQVSNTVEKIQKENLIDGIFINNPFITETENV